jgi:hypothetical protein
MNSLRREKSFVESAKVKEFVLFIGTLHERQKVRR